jgi:hypothetical protein
MDMSDKQNTFDLEEVLHWCLQVQKARIRRGLFCEMSSQTLSPVLHRELLAFAKVAQVIASNSQRTNSQSDGTRSSAEPPRKIEVREEIKNLEPEDRHLLREALNEIAANFGQRQTSNVARDTVYLEEHIDDQNKSSVD